ncbi:MAG: hypothetical protein IJT77_11545 [Clostridia bacterium]|nr:hypothetical protein [Clostridia bacterium]
MTGDVHSPDFCLRCLLREMRGQEAGERLKQIREWIMSIPAQYRAGNELVERRLDICRNCPNLSDGTCRLCGCYVEYRAAHVLRGCPDLPARWPQVEED